MIMELIRLIMTISFLGVFLCSSNMIKFNDACNPREREALINFKHNLEDPYDALSSWVVGNDCCKWEGVICKHKTEGDVVQLQLSNFWLRGELNSSLLELKHLYHLDLSFNSFKQIPAFLGSFQNLRYLHLGSCEFTGKIPSQLGNLSRLYYLDLSSDELEGEIPASLGSLQNLRYLDLSDNELEGEIPRTLGNLCNLEELDLSGNEFQGELSRLFRKTSKCSANKLKLLSLQYNQFSGRLPDELGRLSLLKDLILHDNKFNGSLPESFGHLMNLERLLISNNMLEGDVTEAHFANLKKLHVLDINSVNLNMSRDWVPPFQIRDLLLQNCSVGYQFPEWLRTQKHLRIVDISNAGISGSVPSWFWNTTSQMAYVNISHNQLEGDLSNVSLQMIRNIYLNSNRFTGNLPLISNNTNRLDLSYNYFWGPISVLLCNPVEDMNSLEYLDLSENQLSGMIPDCWSPWKSLVFISFSSNNITGNVPSSMGLLSKLQILHLQTNSIDGELPSSLQNCTILTSLDLGENRLTGSIPTWIGERLECLSALRLHSNKFQGEIPRKLCYSDTLQILDLGDNNLSGSIPKCFRNFSRMASVRYRNPVVTYLGSKNNVNFVAKGKDMTYGERLLQLVAGIDLSSNNLYGEIPEELTYLFELQMLNLANNSFSGGIPKGIGHLNSLESLDLSNNRLSGSIPQSLTNLTFLSYLNLSYNNLSGRIPSSTQLGTFSELSYTGNHDLCGLPLDKCDEDGPRQKEPNGDGEGSMEDDKDEDWVEMKWFYMGTPFGFVVGFWCLWGVLLVKKSWRYAYFRFLDDIIYKLSTCLKKKKK